MRQWFYSAALASLVFVSCSEESSVPTFKLNITAYHGGDTVYYCLSDSGLTLDIHASPRITSTTTTTSGLKYYPVSGQDSLQYIAGLDIKAYSCQEQHALMALDVVFTNDSGTVNVNPYVNHPKELDMAVRIINSLVEEKYRLKYEDVQRAIEPIDKMRV